MKKVFLFLLFIATYATLYAQVPQKQAFDVIKSTILKKDTSNIHVYVSKNVIVPQSVIKTMYKDITSPNFTSWLFFIDDAPFQNWGHPSRFIFVGSKGQIEIKSYPYPPSLENMDILIEKRIKRTDVRKMQIQSNIKVTPKNISTTQNEYAIIISGGYDRFNNYERYWNDCAAIYSTLRNVYNYDRSHIYVLMADGTNPAIDRRRLDGTYDSSPLDLDGDGVDDIQFAATKANITTVFNTLSRIMTNEDNLFIYTTDHGGVHSEQDVFMYLWNETIEDYEFATEVNKITAKTMNIVMEQCNSGGFIDNLAGPNRVIATACKADQSSFAMPPNYDYNEFVFHWTSAIAGQTPLGTIVNADTNNDDFVTANDAFIYAKTQDTQSESPQYSSQPTNLGLRLTLSGVIPTIAGSTHVCVGSSYTFTVTNPPPGFNWGVSPNLTINGPANNNTVTVTKSGINGMGSVCIMLNGRELVSYDVYVGTPVLAIDIEGPSTVQNSQINTFEISSITGGFIYTWSGPPNVYGIHSTYSYGTYNNAQIYS